MLFVAIILASVGYTLVYAGVKGDAYTVGGHPVWKQPWLPFFAVFSRRPNLAAAVKPSSDPEQFYLSALAANNPPASSSSNGSSAPAAAVPPSQAGGAPGAAPSGLAGPGFQ